MDTIQQTKSSQESSIFINMVVSAWESQNKKVDALLDRLTEAQWNEQVAPGRNTGVYLLGHLVAVNDGMIPLLGFGDRLYAGLEKIFLESPDQRDMERPGIATLKKYWVDINALLRSRMAGMNPDDWFARHQAVSGEDFAKEPHRNKLNILLNRSIHQGYHLGQLAFL